MTNPLLAPWNTPFQMPPFAEIADSDFAPALDVALERAQTELNAITETPDVPDFDNTLGALEQVGADLERVAATFYALLGPCSTPEREVLAVAFGGKIAAFESALKGNAALFARIESVWNARAELNEAQVRLVEVTRQSFLRGGAELRGAEADRLANIMGRLAELGTKFTQTVLADERDWFMELDDAALAALPDFVRDACRAAGAERELGPIVTLSRSVIVPFLQFSPDRALRKRAYEAWQARGEGQGDADNRLRAAEILRLRQERAALLGFENFARYKLANQMAQSPEAVRDLLMQVWAPARKAAVEDAEILEKMLREDGGALPLEPWDWHYYSERRRRAEHDLDEAEIKPYFQLDQMVEAAFDCAHRLFGLEFVPVDVPVWHEDCRAWEVRRDGAHMALFIADYFARPGKRSGAWCSSILGQQNFPDRRRPQVINICNFAKGDPALLSFDDASTLFHEFGHALHYILSDVDYPSLAGLKVERDFVELPSQLFEHWLALPEVLDQFAHHVETGEPMPAALRDRVLAAETYDAGFHTVEYLATALVDLELHDGPAPADIMQKQAEILEAIGLPSAIRMRHATPHLMHAFAGDGYSAGYYSYMWAEVMDADAFDAFPTPFDPATAKRLEDEILSRGHTRKASEHYTAFRGRLPGVEPLLKGRGLA